MTDYCTIFRIMNVTHRPLSTFLSILFGLLIIGCKSESKVPEESIKSAANTPAAYSIGGEPLTAPEPSQEALSNYTKARKLYFDDTDDAENIIWYGRRAAYIGKYKDAIDIFSEGIKKFPADSRFYRHRGHRYITLREFDKAIEDLKIATSLIQGKENEVEPDGLPNARNIPVSTLHGNIWYHLGLAYYLQEDWPNALVAYQQCRRVGDLPDNLVSSSHWIYMILRRMGREKIAEKSLGSITADLDIIENMSYHQLCLFYKGEISLEELKGGRTSTAGNDAVDYAIGNWYFVNDDMDAAKMIWEEVLKRDSWSSFGYIAAQADMRRL